MNAKYIFVHKWKNTLSHNGKFFFQEMLGDFDKGSGEEITVEYKLTAEEVGRKWVAINMSLNKKMSIGEYQKLYPDNVEILPKRSFIQKIKTKFVEFFAHMKIKFILFLGLFLISCTTYQPYRYEKATGTAKSFWPECQILVTNTHYSFLVKNELKLYFVYFDENGDVYSIERVKE